jgi:hypothetical protein
MSTYPHRKDYKEFIGLHPLITAFNSEYSKLLDAANSGNWDEFTKVENLAWTFPVHDEDEVFGYKYSVSKNAINKLQDEDFLQELYQLAELHLKYRGWDLELAEPVEQPSSDINWENSAQIIYQIWRSLYAFNLREEAGSVSKFAKRLKRKKIVFVAEYKQLPYRMKPTPSNVGETFLYNIVGRIGLAIAIGILVTIGRALFRLIKAMFN